MARRSVAGQAPVSNLENTPGGLARGVIPATIAERGATTVAVAEQARQPEAS
jgi:hypothetical protein